MSQFEEVRMRLLLFSQAEVYINPCLYKMNNIVKTKQWLGMLITKSIKADKAVSFVDSLALCPRYDGQLSLWFLPQK